MKTKALILIGLLIVATCTAMAITNENAPSPATVLLPANSVVNVSGKLSQDKIYANGKRTFDLMLTMTADNIIQPKINQEKPVDMVIVLDRSGSMAGKKIMDAKNAVRGLLEKLSDRDRFALVTYSNFVQSDDNLAFVTSENRERCLCEIDAVSAGGGTNLGAGLIKGIDILSKAAEKERIGKVILVSDGKANQGITDPDQLAAMAKTRHGLEYAVTTVGVGKGFNEQLMASIADTGRGTYYYLENPENFLAVFTEEFKSTRAVAASSFFIHVPLPNGVEVISASGYPVKTEENMAVISPGDLLSGQTKTIYISMRAKNSLKDDFSIKNISASYTHNGKALNSACPGAFGVTITDKSSLALGSIDKTVWERKILSSDYNELREKVAKDIRDGKKETAVGRISAYQREMGKINETVASPGVAHNIEKECDQLRLDVEETFTGDKGSVIRKQKSTSKLMQYLGYKGRRGKN